MIHTGTSKYTINIFSTIKRNNIRKLYHEVLRTIVSDIIIAFLILLITHSLYRYTIFNPKPNMGGASSSANSSTTVKDASISIAFNLTDNMDRSGVPNE